MWLSWFSKFKLVSIRFYLVAVRFKLVAKLVAKVIFVPDPKVHSKMAASCLVVPREFTMFLRKFSAILPPIVKVTM